MAKKVIEGNAIEGIFTQEAEQENSQKVIEKQKKMQGRPKAKDLTENTELVKRAFYITPKQDEDIGIYAIKNKMDKSEAIRFIVNGFFETQII